MDRVRVLLADDHAILLEGLKRVLESRLEIVDTAADGRAILEKARALKPDLVIMDIAMPLLNGIEATERLRHELPETRVIVLTMYAEREYVRAALRAGASGYILKQHPLPELLAGIEAVIAGDIYVSPELADPADEQPGTWPARDDMFGRELTPRQREVLQLVAEGKTAKEIAALLEISTKTVEFHKAQIGVALGLRTATELTRYAVEHGMVGKMPPPVAAEE